MLGDKAWLAVSVPIHPKGVQWGWAQGSVQASQVLPHRSQETISVWTSLCALGHCSTETGKGFPNCCNNVGSTESSRMSLYVVKKWELFRSVFSAVGRIDWCQWGSPVDCVCAIQRHFGNLWAHSVLLKALRENYRFHFGEFFFRAQSGLPTYRR